MNTFKLYQSWQDSNKWSNNSIDWEEYVRNKTVETQVSNFDELLFGIYSVYIPNKTVLCYDKDPPWMPDGIKTAVKLKNDAYKEYVRSGISKITMHNMRT